MLTTSNLLYKDAGSKHNLNNRLSWRKNPQDLNRKLTLDVVVTPQDNKSTKAIQRFQSSVLRN